jgi:cysteine-rich repeat protein
LGDLDGSGGASIVDVQCALVANLWVLGGSLGLSPGCLSSPVAADVNCSGDVSVLDVQLAISAVLGAPLDPSVDSDGDGCVDACATLPPAALPPEPGQVSVTEWRAPIANTPAPDAWVELHNTSASAVDLAGALLMTNGGVGEIGGPAILPPGAYFTVAANLDPALHGGHLHDQVVSGNALAGGGWLELRSPTGALLDRVELAKGPPVSVNTPPGASRSTSLGRGVTASTANDNPALWCASPDDYGIENILFGSPGRANPSCGRCGDAEVQPFEACDLGLLNSGPAPAPPISCNFDCTFFVSRCGDSRVDSSELCDDGNSISGDGCEPNCLFTPYFPCGNGIAFGPEQCDDGNLESNDGCSAQCTWENICGNGVVEPGEECDAGGENSDVLAGACRNNCRKARCGDGALDAGETCDNGNTLPGDGCSRLCEVESGFSLKPGELFFTEHAVVAKGGNAFNGMKSEWLEVYNPGSAPVSLEGLTLRGDSGDRHVIEEELWVQPGEHIVLANTNNPSLLGGVTPHHVYSGFRLNLQSEVVLAAGPLVIDGFSRYPLAVFPNSIGSQALRLDAYDAVSNDERRAWCVPALPWVSGLYASPGGPVEVCLECGNGVLEPGEKCDDGPLNSDTHPDACRTNCKLSGCGDGVLDAGEECEDDGSSESCTWDCLLIGVCGDGLLGPYEQCDDGAANSDTLPGACRADCVAHRCGDAVTDPGEACDGEPGCTLQCAWALGPLPEPGQIVISEIMARPVSAGEGRWLELHNTTASTVFDLTGHTIELERPTGPLQLVLASKAGPLLLPPGGYMVLATKANLSGVGGPTVALVLPGLDWLSSTPNVRYSAFNVALDQVPLSAGFPRKLGASWMLSTDALDATSNDSAENWCASWLNFGGNSAGTPGAANGICPVCGDGLVEGGEECDNGALNDNSLADACRLDCLVAACGDGVLDTGEQCDGMGCTAACVLPASNQPCGDGFIEFGEKCDDGNLDGGDGCDSTCVPEGSPPLPGELVISEVMFDPDDSPDNGGEWIEVYNASGHWIDLTGLRVFGAAGSMAVVRSGSSLAPGAFVVLSGWSEDAPKRGISGARGFSAGVPRLSNDGNAVRLEAPDGALIDAAFSQSVASLEVPAGASISLSSAALAADMNDEPGVWCEGSAVYGFTDRGTPGLPNPECP